MYLAHEVTDDFIDYIDYDNPKTLGMPMKDKKLVVNAPQSAIDAFENYKKLLEKFPED